MTTLHNKTTRCSVCGTEAEDTVIASTNAFGSPDLDTRPPEMKRSTIRLWVQRCYSCGNCASDLSQASACARDIIQTQEYTAQLKDSDFPELVNSFICKSIIDENGKEWATAAWALIHAAWACDDAKLSSQAIMCRRRAAAMLRKVATTDQKLVSQPGLATVILIDLLRRAGEMDEAVTVIQENRYNPSEGIMRQIIDYQMDLINAKDLDCHTIAEAISKGSVPAQHRKAKRWWRFWI